MPAPIAIGALMMAMAVAPSGAAAQAQQQVSTRGMTVLEAARTTLGRHPLLQLQTQVVQGSAARLEQATGVFDTGLFVSGEHSDTDSPLSPLEQQQAGAIGVLANVRSLESTVLTAGMVKRSRTGISFGPTLQLNRFADNLALLRGRNESRISFDLAVPVFQLGSSVGGALERASRLDLDSNQLALRHRAAELTFVATADYWAYRAAVRALEVTRGSEARGQELLSSAQTLVDGDQLPRSELHQVRANLADRRARTSVAEQRVLEARNALALAMGLRAEETSLVGLPIDAFPEPTGIPELSAPLALDRYQSMALELRGDYRSASRDMRAADVLQVAARRERLPQLDLQLSAGYSGVDEGRNLGGDFLSPSFQGLKGPNLTVGFSIVRPLANRVLRGRFAESLATLEQARFFAADLERTIETDVETAAGQVERAAEQLAFTGEAVSAYESALAGEQEKIRLGVGSLIDLLVVEDRLTAALLAHVTTQSAYGIAVAQFRFATGTLISADGALDLDDDSPLTTLPDVRAGSNPSS